MSKKYVALICVALSLMFCFISVGYAAMSTSLKIKGTAEVEIPAGLFITKIEQKGSSSVGRYSSASFASYSTTVTNVISKSKEKEAASLTYNITVLNNTDKEYAYRDVYYQSNLANHNNNIVVFTDRNSSTKIYVDVKFPNGTVVPAGKELTFTVTYKLGSDKSLKAQQQYVTLLNYQFGINVESEPEAVEVVHGKFLDILNTTLTYDMLIDAIDNKYDGYQEWTSNYIGNVTDATNDDSVAVNNLFAGHLQLVIGGQTKPATVLIKHEDLDQNPYTGDDYKAVNDKQGSPFYGYGCEMTLYLTTDDLELKNGKTQAPVYVTVFTCNRDSNGNIGRWYRIGEVYLGTAPIVTYDGNYGGGSFITDNWVSEADTYYVTDHYSYSVGSGETLKTLSRVVDPKAIEEFQRLLLIAKELIDDYNYAGTGIEAIEEVYERAELYFTRGANGVPVANDNSARAFLIPLIEDLDRTITDAKNKIDDILGRG